MKLTKETLKKIIKEELEAVMSEGAIYTTAGAYQILNPDNPSDDEAFLQKTSVVSKKLLNDPNNPVGAREQIEAKAKKSLEDAEGTARGRRPSQDHSWVYLAYANKNNNYGWVWYDTSKAIDVLPNTYTRANPDKYKV